METTSRAVATSQKKNRMSSATTITTRKRTTTSKSRAIPSPLKLRESDIQRTCEDILKWDGWRIFRIEKNFSEKKQKATGELGAPDALCIRYRTFPQGFASFAGHAEVMWIEWKALNGIPSCEQQLWHRAQLKLGALVLCAGINFPATIDGFKQWYAASGLQRRK